MAMTVDQWIATLSAGGQAKAERAKTHLGLVGNETIVSGSISDHIHITTQAPDITPDPVDSYIENLAGIP
jgi:hypothetical protein